jgi:hypothetical protein
MPGRDPFKLGPEADLGERNPVLLEINSGQLIAEMLLFLKIDLQTVDDSGPKGADRKNWQHNHHTDVNSNLSTSLNSPSKMRPGACVGANSTY